MGMNVLLCNVFVKFFDIFRFYVQIIVDFVLKMGFVGVENCVVFQVFDVKVFYVFLINRLIEMFKIWYLYLFIFLGLL